MARRFKFLTLRLTCRKAVLLVAAAYFCGILFLLYGKTLTKMQDFSSSSAISAAPRLLYSSIKLTSTLQNLSEGGESKTEGSIGNRTIGTTLITTPKGEIITHPFNFTILETDICQNVNSSMPLLLVIVHSDPRHHDFRTAIRETWANENASQYGLDSHMDMRVLFTMGSIPDDQNTMEKVKNESQIYHDIIQENFIDTYRNLTHKVVMWLKWATFYCSNAFQILKIDDDVFVNRFSVLKFVRDYYDRGVAQNRTLSCRVWYGMEVIRDNSSKWYVSPDDWEADVYPPYCSGGGYMLSGDLPKLLYEKSAGTRFIWVDDVYATGLLSQEVGNVTFENIGSKFVISDGDLMNLGNSTRNALYFHLGTQSKPHYDWWGRVLTEYGLSSTSYQKECENGDADRKRLEAEVEHLRNQVAKHQRIIKELRALLSDTL